MTIAHRRIIVTEEIEDLSETQATYIAQPTTQADAVELLQSVLLPGELLKLARRLAQARDGGGFVTVGVQFEKGHARKIVVTESETLDRQ